MAPHPIIALAFMLVGGKILWDNGQVLFTHLFGRAPMPGEAEAAVAYAQQMQEAGLTQEQAQQQLGAMSLATSEGAYAEYQMFEDERTEAPARGQAPVPHALANMPPGYDHVAYGNDPSGVRAIAYYNMPNIRDRANLIREGIRIDSLRPEIITTTRQILSRKVRTHTGMRWAIEPKDYRREVEAIYKATLDPSSPFAVRYLHDHPEVDHFGSAVLTMRVAGEDCDGGVRSIGARLRAVGYPIKLRLIQTTNPNATDYEHIYLVVGLPPLGPTEWLPLDWSTGNAPGWEIEGASEVAETGRPAGFVVRVMDVLV